MIEKKQKNRGTAARVARHRARQAGLPEPPKVKARLFLRLDTCAVETSSYVLWGAPLSDPVPAWVNRGWLRAIPRKGDVPYLPISAKRAAPALDLGAEWTPKTAIARLPEEIVAQTVERCPTARQARIAFLLKRDGPKCLYCRRLVWKDGEPVDLSVEHIVPLSKGGTDNPSNLGLCCGVCQRMMGDLSVVEKVRLAIERKRRKYARD